VEDESVAVRRENEREPQDFGVLQRLLDSVADTAVVVLGFDNREWNVRLPRTMMRPFVKLTSSRSWVISSQPA